MLDSFNFVVPAEAGIHFDLFKNQWIPAFAGMTNKRRLPQNSRCPAKACTQRRFGKRHGISTFAEETKFPAIAGMTTLPNSDYWKFPNPAQSVPVAILTPART